MRVTTRLDTSDLKAGIDSLKKKFPQAVKRALKRAGTSGRAEMVRRISADTGLTQTAVRKEIRVNLVGDTAVELEVTGQRIPLIAFGAKGPEPSRGRGAGVTYRLPGSRGRAEHAFIAKMPTGHRGVYARTPGARATKKGRSWTELPIVELFGPSLVKVFEKYLPEGAARAQEALVNNVRSEISFAMRR